MAISRFRRLELVLGASIDGLTLDHLKDMAGRAQTADPVREDFDLDFKEALYGARDEDKHHLAEDVAALANTHGGVIFLGVRADKQTSIAVELTPVPLSDSERLRMQHIIATHVAPPPAFEIKLIVAEPGTGFFAIVVPPSPSAPHAVRAANMSLRYYRRDGSGNRPLAETEVAEIYRRRFTQSAARETRLGEIRAEMGRMLQADNDIGPWLALALVPELPGSMSITARTLRALREKWLPQFTNGFVGDAPFVRCTPQISTGVSRVIVSEYRKEPNAPPHYAYAELHVDGSGFAAVQIHPASPSFRDPGNLLYDEQLFAHEAGLLRMLSDHAVSNCGTRGDALAATGLLVCLREFRIGCDRWQGIRQALRDSRGLAGVPPLPSHTLSLDAVALDGRERLVATRVLLADLIHAFGLPEVLQVTPGGELRSLYWNDGVLDHWTGMRDVPRVDAKVEEG